MFDNPKAGIGYAGEFQSSALPWVTSSQAPLASGTPTRIEFPKVTRFITITNNDAAANKLRVAFTQNGLKVNGNYYLVPGGGVTVSFEVRVRSLYIAGDTTLCPYSLLAGLTTVDSGMMPFLTGTLLSGSGGWEGVG